MIINVKASTSTDVGNYLTDRDKEAFTLIEGDASRFDYICEKTLSENTRKKISHYSYVLSFKEEHLTKDDLVNYYLQFKEKMFLNYDLSELEILSVIHWDDNKPHIHCTVVNSSQLDNSDLQLYRGYVDFSRVEAVQEIINYENDLSSVFDSHNLLSLTPEQKRRDWKVKKREVPYYKVFDDYFYEEIDKLLKIDTMVNFDTFIDEIENKFGKVAFVNSNKLKSSGFNESTLLKETKLVLTEKFTSKGETYSFNSKLFDKNWFNKNILKIKTNLLNRNVNDIKYKIKKKSYKDQLKILKETTKKHEEHIYGRKVGKKYISDNVDYVFKNSVKTINKFKINSLNKELLETQIERLLFIANKKNLEYFIKNLDIESYLISEEGYIEYIKNGTAFKIYNDELINIYKSNPNSKYKDKELKDIEQLIYQSLENLKSNKEKAKLRAAIEELFYLKKVKSKNELVELLKKYNINIDRVGHDTKKGHFITLIHNNNKVRLYNDIIYNTLNHDDSLYIDKRENAINQNLKDDFLSHYIKSVYLDLHKSNEYNYINSINGYRLHKSQDVLNAYFSIAKKNDFNSTNNDFFKYKNHPYNDYEQVEYNMANGSFKINKSLDKYKTGKNIADMYFMKGSTDINISENMDNELLEGFIDRVKEKNYNITVWNNNKLIYINKNTPQSPKSEMNDDEARYNAIEVSKRLKENGGIDKLLKYIDELENIDVHNSDDVKKFKEIMKTINKNNKNALEAICLTSGINIVRVGHDTKKGEYATFEYKGKKISLYDNAVVKNIEQGSSKELLLSL